LTFEKVINERLKQSINLQAYELEVVKAVAAALGIQLKDSDIQRAHRIGRKKTSKHKPRPIIVCFVSYKKRNQFLCEKAKLKNNEDCIDIFISEDLTPLRTNVKHCCDNQFVLCHSMNGKI